MEVMRNLKPKTISSKNKKNLCDEKNNFDF